MRTSRYLFLANIFCLSACGSVKTPFVPNAPPKSTDSVYTFASETGRMQFFSASLFYFPTKDEAGAPLTENQMVEPLSQLLELSRQADTVIENIENTDAEVRELKEAFKQLDVSGLSCPSLAENEDAYDADEVYVWSWKLDPTEQEQTKIETCEQNQNTRDELAKKRDELSNQLTEIKNKCTILIGADNEINIDADNSWIYISTSNTGKLITNVRLEAVGPNKLTYATDPEQGELAFSEVKYDMSTKVLTLEFGDYQLVLQRGRFLENKGYTRFAGDLVYKKGTPEERKGSAKFDMKFMSNTSDN